MTTPTTLVMTPQPGVFSRSAPGWACNIGTIARRELRDAIGSRWFVLYALAFAVLGLAVSYASSASAGGSGFAGYGRTTAGLVNLVLLVVPIMALSAGAGSIASERERGMLAYVLAQPVTRVEVLLGKYLGLAGALLACLCLGLGACAGVLMIKGGGSNAVGLAWLAALAFLLALAMLSVGVLVSVLARCSSVAVGAAIFLWLAFVFISDLGLMAGTMALKLRIEDLFALSLANPVQVFKMWSLHASEGSLDVLGPAGLYATEEFGRRLHLIFAGVLAAWIIMPLVAAGYVFSRRTGL